MKTKFLNIFITLLVITLFKFAYEKYTLSQNSHFTVTQDTIIVPGSEISKYVTGEEVDSFNFRYWDIDDNKTYQEKNSTLIPLRNSLKLKDSKAVIAFLKDKNISVNVKMRDDTTPLMYSSFYDDENTMKELIKLGANLRAKDKYGLNPLAYAIENNSTKTAKLLLDNGVKFDEVEFIQFYLSTPQYQDFIDKIIIDGDNIKIIYKFDYGDKSPYSKNKANPFRYIISHNLIEILEMIFNTGYKKDNETFLNFKDGYYSALPEIPNYEQMLNLLLEHNISGQPSKEFLMSEYEECYERYIDFPDIIQGYIERIEIEGRAEYIIERRVIETNDVSWSNIYEGEFLNLNPRPADKKVIEDIKLDMVKYKEFCSDKNSTFKSIKEYINYKNWINKKYAIGEITYRNPEKVYLKDKNMTLKEFQDIEYEKYLNENRGKNGKKLK